MHQCCPSALSWFICEAGMNSGELEFGLPECYIYGSLLLHRLLSVTFRFAHGEA